MHSQEIAALWIKINEWLLQHTPEVQKNLQPGTTQKKLEKLEQALDCIGLLPEDFKESYKIHNGMETSCLFRTHYFLKVEEIVEEWKINKDVMEEQMTNENSQSNNPDDDPNRKVRDKWFDARWIPFTRDGTGCGLYIDLNPDKGGTVGQVVLWNHEGECDFVANSFTDYLKEFIEELYAGTYYLSDDGKDLEMDD